MLHFVVALLLGVAVLAVGTLVLQGLGWVLCIAIDVVCDTDFVDGFWSAPYCIFLLLTAAFIAISGFLVFGLGETILQYAH
jgi:hypothetical protein